MNFKKSISVFLAFLLLFTCGCSSAQNPEETTAPTAQTAEITTLSAGDMFSDRDVNADYNESDCAKITLADNKSTSTDNSVNIAGNTITISAEGDYILSGKLTDGQIIVNCKDTEKPRLILNSAEITCKTSAPVYVKEADKVVITLADKTQNSLSVSGEFKNIDENNIDSAVFSKSDLTFNGNGTLKVSCTNGHGIVSKDDLVFSGGSYTVYAGSHAIDANDSIRATDSSFKLTSGKDGFHAENTDDASLGFIFLQKCSFETVSEGDGIDSSSSISIESGTYKITSGSGSANAEAKQEEFAPHMNQTSSTADDTVSAKGIKSGGDLSINGSSIICDSADDAIHSNSSLAVNATLTLKSGDDGIHADSDTVIKGGTVTISESYEGIEGQTVSITGGTITIKSSDDGINAAGGVDESGFGGGMKRDNFAADNNSYVKISGGKITIDAGGDGVDSNGSLEVTGGETYVWGPTNSGNGALDYGSSAVISGGIFVATGMSGMAMNFTSATNQGAMLANVSGTNSLKVKTSDGKEILSCSPVKSYQCAVISCPEITQGNTYNVLSDSASTSVEMTSAVTGASNGMPGGGMQGGGKGGHGGMQTPPDGFGSGNRMPR
ncbi:MAG: carbohydrate-binding domain-containing protein [Clostridia bacterium]|nr:carbohydrate-binding domain-containing protein [Clostridia bacterium]